MVRKLPILLGLIFFFSLSARAQDTAEIFGGYSFDRLGSTPGRNLNGWEVAGEYKFASFFGVAGDVDGHYGSPSQVDTRTVDFMVGPQVSLPGRISPFAHVLGGISHIRAGGGSDTSFATAFGGGIDLRLVPIISWRVIQADDVVTRFFGSTQNTARISTGLVFRF